MPLLTTPLAPNELLTTHGMDSMVATEIAAALGDAFGISVSPTIAFDYPTLGSLSERIVQLVAERNQSLSEVVVFRRGGR